MAYLRIFCESCGNKWEVYKRNINDDNARQCPHCYKRIERNVWNRSVLPALCAVDEVNIDLFKDHTFNHVALFSFDVIGNHLYKNRNKGENRPYKEPLNSSEAN